MLNCRELFKKQINFIGAFQNSYDGNNIFLKSNLPEIAFLGRSNVGKSSFINALFNRKSLARISNTPGRTAQLNFFELDKKLIVVDMPGYGYAKTSKENKYIWGELIKSYLFNSLNLKRLYLLIDARHGIKESDNMIMDFLDNIPVNYQIVFTKIDKCKGEQLRTNVNKALEVIAKKRLSCKEILEVSSTKRVGFDKVMSNICSIL